MMAEVETRGRKECHLVTGGGGYMGLKLGTALHQMGHEVVLFDVREPVNALPEGIKFVKGDILEGSQVEKVTENVDCVYHLASYGMSGREMLNRKLIEAVNITGSNNVIQACLKNGVERLVYTSTFNVVFGGQEIQNGDESLPYFPTDKHPDHYSATKCTAEKMILKASGSQTETGGSLHSCALRLAGVYGPGEQRHLPRIVSYIESGLFSMVYGSADSLVEFLHIDNLVQAHIKAGQALTKTNNYIADGQAYFISDCKPVNNFEFFRPLVEGLGYKYPKLRFPVNIVYYIAFLIEMIHYLIGHIYNFQPLLTRAEVFKTGVTHYFSNDKAKKQLGYAPTVQNDLTEVVQWFAQNGHAKKSKPLLAETSFRTVITDILLAAMFASMIMSFLPIVV